jgi:hypothetical protein
MSKGLGGIGNDPQATPLTRKMLGILSTPGLLVYDDAITIDDTGRIVLKLAPNSGMQIGKEGLALTPVEPAAVINTFVGIDSEVDPRSEAYDREWNARLTGPAPNYIEGSVAIGAEEFGGVTEAFAYETVEKAKVNITNRETQLRLSYNIQNYLAFRANENGSSELFNIGLESPGFHIITGDGSIGGVAGGLRLNFGDTLKRIIKVKVNVAYGGGGTFGQWTGYYVPGITITFESPDIVFGPSTDLVSVSPGSATPVEYQNWSASITGPNTINLYVMFFGVTAATSVDWIFVIHQF